MSLLELHGLSVGQHGLSWLETRALSVALSAWLGVTVTLTGTLQSLGAVVNEHLSMCCSLWYELWNSWSHNELQQ